MFLDRTYVLENGHRVRIRMARTSDARAIQELAARRGLDADLLDAARLTRFDPRRRVVISATALIDSHETLVGIGAVDLDQDEPFEPDTLIFDERIGGLGTLLLRALSARARALSWRHAA